MPFVSKQQELVSRFRNALMAKASLAAIPEAPEAPTTSASIKDAYSEWLRDVDALTRKRKGKNKNKRLSALRHLAQPTESSAKKKFEALVSDPARRPTIESSEQAAACRAEAQRRRFQSLADEASYAHFSYEPPWSPGLAFFAVLADYAESRAMAVTGVGRPGGLRHSNTTISRREIAHFPVQVPPTALRLLRQPLGVVLLFTVEQQHLESEAEAIRKLGRNPPPPSASGRKGRTETDWTLQFHFFSTRELFESRLPWILRILTGAASDVNSSTVHAVFKISSERGNRVRPLESPQVAEEALRSLWDDGNTTATGCYRAVQTYIPSKGTLVPSGAGGGGRAWIARPAYRKKDHSAATVWILTGSTSLFATTEWASDSSPPCQIVKCTTAQSWQAPRVLCETLCQSLDVHVLRGSGVGSFAELVVDLVQDPSGHWWLLQVKAFQLRRPQLPTPSVTEPCSRARSAPDRLETMSVASMSSKASGFQTKAKWKCAGRYCHCGNDEAFHNDDNNNTDPVQRDEPSGFLTKKELLSCEFYDNFRASDDASLSGGCSSFSGALLFYLQHQLTKRDRTVLYEPQAVCSVCIQRYYALRTGMDALVACASDRINKKPLPPRAVRTSKLPTSKSLAALPIVGNRSTKLPGLAPLPPARLLHARHSTPEMASGVVVAVAPPSYMDELERIEQLLADGNHDQKQLLPQQPPQGATIKDAEGVSELTTPYLPANPQETTTAFSWQSRSSAMRADRVEEMWQSIKLKPLAAAASSDPSARTYNSFSLEAALREATLSATPSADQQHKPHQAPHLISIVDCRRVFSDEPFRESLVRETIQRLLVNRQAVRFVVLPPDDPEDDQTSQDLALGRMALRTLALDVDQLLAQEGVSVTRGLPSIDGDAAQSGCLFMTVPVPGTHL